ncbi:hypothetical protein [Nocardioides marinquilinus]
MRPVSWLALTAVGYQGVSEVVIRLTDADQLVAYRPSRAAVDNGMVVAGLALLALTIGYLVAHPPAPVEVDVDTGDLARALDWRIFAVLTVPLVLTTASGRGYSSGQPLDTQGAIDAGGLGSQFFVPMVILTAFAYLLRHPRQYAFVLVAQSIGLAVAGQRLEVLVAAAALTALAMRVGLRPGRRQLVVTVAVALAAVVAINSVRTTAGREVFQSDSGFAARFDALREGLTNPTATSDLGPGALAEAALRLDSASWTGAVYEALHEPGVKPAGAHLIRGAVLTSVPSVLFPSKTTVLTELDRSPEAATIVALRMERVDYLPGHLTLFYGALGLWGLLLFNLLVGMALGLLERAALRRASPVAIVGLLTLLQSALFYERGIDYYLLAGRSFFVLAVLVYVLGAVVGYRAGPRAQDPGRLGPTGSPRRPTPAVRRPSVRPRS